jgi:hypothetical protein
MEAIRGGDAQARLARALVANAQAAGCTLTVEAAQAKPWASATYVGDQQSLVVHATPAAAARRWLAALADADLPIRGHVAMPPAMDGVEDTDDGVRVRLTVLTLRDG